MRVIICHYHIFKNSGTSFDELLKRLRQYAADERLAMEDFEKHHKDHKRCYV